MPLWQFFYGAFLRSIAKPIQIGEGLGGDDEPAKERKTVKREVKKKNLGIQFKIWTIRKLSLTHTKMIERSNTRHSRIKQQKKT